MKRTLYTATIGLVIPVLWCGCGGADAPPAADPANIGATDSVSGQPADVSMAPADHAENTDSGDGPEPHSRPAAAAAATIPATFEPPFSDRVDLFAIPNRQNPIEKQAGSDEQSIELKGFVNVGKRRAVIAINGVTSPIAEGETRYGVQVVSIEPPRVVLQRGRSRWTTTLAN